MEGGREDEEGEEGGEEGGGGRGGGRRWEGRSDEGGGEEGGGKREKEGGEREEKGAKILFSSDPTPLIPETWWGSTFLTSIIILYLPPPPLSPLSPYNPRTQSGRGGWYRNEGPKKEGSRTVQSPNPLHKKLGKFYKKPGDRVCQSGQLVLIYM